jgi:hypothetical protein
MITREQCIRELDAAAAAADDPQNAYQVRTRVKRALLSTVRRVARLHGFKEPALPGVFEFSQEQEALDSAREVLDLCNQLHIRVGRLCQPSESLDTRWTEGWREVVADMGRLRALI